MDVRSLSDFDIVDDGSDSDSTRLYVRSEGVRSQVRKEEADQESRAYGVEGIRSVEVYLQRNTSVQ